jgi:ABC-type antimicrobial peptide transport system permease subunit
LGVGYTCTISPSCIPSLKLLHGCYRLPARLDARFSFENLLPGEIIWRRKEETDISRGTDKLSRIVSSRMSDEEFEQISKEVGVASREEAYYYKMMV